jgi:hypothetical protein
MVVLSFKLPLPGATRCLRRALRKKKRRPALRTAASISAKDRPECDHQCGEEYEVDSDFHFYLYHRDYSTMARAPAPD